MQFATIGIPPKPADHEQEVGVGIFHRRRLIQSVATYDTGGVNRWLLDLLHCSFECSCWE